MPDAPASDPPADTVSLRIAAPADRLYDLVSDITGMGRLSPECTGGSWLRGADGPAVGARFRGWNKRGLARWFTTNEVVAADPGRAFAFKTLQSGTTWSYRFEPDGDATLVTESRQAWRSRPFLARAFSALALGGSADHDEEMRAGMQATLERLKALAES